MGNWPGPEGQPADSSSLQSSVVRERFDGLYGMDMKPCRAEAESTPSMRIYVHASLGRLVGLDGQQGWWEGGYTGYLSAPTTNPRYDLVYLNPTGLGSLGVVTGTEAASPNTPALVEETVPIAYLLMRPGMTSIKDVDDGVNGWIALRITPYISNATGAVSVKKKDSSDQTVSATTTETAITAATYTIPAGMLSTNNWLDMFLDISDLDLSAGESIVLRAKYDGTTFASLTIPSDACNGMTNQSAMVWIRLRNDGASNSQRGFMMVLGTADIKAQMTAPYASGSAAVDSTLAKDITFTVDFSSNAALNSITVSGQSAVKYS